MTPELRKLILDQLNGHRIMALATNRADGWPQATTVSYVNEGLVLFFVIARVSQKFANIKHDSRVSVAIANDFKKPENIKGISMAGRAELVDDRAEYDRIWTLYIERFPEYSGWPLPGPAFAPLFQIVPEIISALDYSKGFGHSDLITLTKSDLPTTTVKKKHHWFRAE